MTGHETAPEEVYVHAERLATILHEKYYAKTAPDWKPLTGDTIGLLTQIDDMVAGIPDAYISTLSPDVSGLVERLREMRENWALGSKGPVILSEAADALASLSLQLAAAEGASVAPSPSTRVVGSVAYARVRVDTVPNEDGWCFCTPFNHPDDVDRGLTNGETSDQSQFFGQISRLAQPDVVEVKPLEWLEAENERLAAEVEALTHNPPPLPHLRTVEEVGDPTAWLFHEKPPSTHVRGEPAGYLVKRYDLNGVWLDTELSFTKPVIRSTCKTEFVPLYAGRATLSIHSKEGKTDAE